MFHGEVEMVEVGRNLILDALPNGWRHAVFEAAHLAAVADVPPVDARLGVVPPEALPQGARPLEVCRDARRRHHGLPPLRVTPPERRRHRR